MQCRFLPVPGILFLLGEFVCNTVFRMSLIFGVRKKGEWVSELLGVAPICLLSLVISAYEGPVASQLIEFASR